MADNVTLDPGAAGDTIGADEIAAVKYQRIKLIEGADGTNDGDIAAGNPLPVEIIDVDGTTAADIGTIAGAVAGTEMQVDVATVPAPLSTTGGGTEAAAQRVTLANDSTGLVSVDDNAGSLTVDNDDTVSTNNSSTSTLGVDAVFTGTGDDCLGYTSVTVQLDASHDSAASGMTFQFSTDNANWDDVYTFTYTAADGARRFQFAVTGRYFRVVYTNGGTGQSHFRMQAILHRQSILTSIHRAGDDIDPDRSATLVKAVLIAQAAGSGDFTPIDATAGGNLKVSLEEASGGMDIGAGNAGSETLRVSIATDDVNASAIKTAVEGTLTVDNAGTFAVQVDDVGSVVDANNSTTTPLGGSATFTGTGTDLLGYSTVCVTLASDVDSAADGMTFQFSTDNSNWDDVNTFTFDFSASPTRRFQFPVTARYFRVVYTNGAGAQASFRVQTILHTANQLTTIHRLQDDLNPDRSVQVVKAVLFAQAAGAGDFTAVDATAAGNLMVSLQEISNGMDIGAGNAGTETLRVSVSTDDVNLSAIKTAVEGTLTVDNGGTFATQATLQAGTALIGSVSSAPNVSTAYDGVTALTPKFAKLSTASTGNQALIAAVAAKTLRILSIQIIATASTNAIYINDGTADLYGDATRKIPLDVTGAAGLGGITLQMNQLGHFETAAVNRPININLGSANGVIAIATYVEV